MFIPHRKFVLICGNQGYGKSVWAKAFCESLSRLFVSDPMASYPNVDFVTSPDDYIPTIVDGIMPRFRVGTYLDEELPMFCHSAFAAQRCTLVIEECALIFKRAAELPDFFKPLVFMGRHVQVDLLLLAQRANSIPVALRSQANRIVTFKQTDPTDVDALCERIGNEHAESIAALNVLECIDWNADNGTVKKYSVRP